MDLNRLAIDVPAISPLWRDAVAKCQAEYDVYLMRKMDRADKARRLRIMRWEKRFGVVSGDRQRASARRSTK